GLSRRDGGSQVKRTLVVLMMVVVSMWVVGGTAVADPSQPWEKLFGCNGIFPISCPGPDPW
ncbi:MAG: hypothetical protein ACRDLB_16080, partial [Actinomycetota bacterium]